MRLTATSARAVSSLISFKFTLFDPDILLLKMSKKLGFLWSRGGDVHPYPNLTSP